MKPNNAYLELGVNRVVKEERLHAEEVTVDACPNNVVPAVSRVDSIQRREHLQRFNLKLLAAKKPPTEKITITRGYLGGVEYARLDERKLVAQNSSQVRGLQQRRFEQSVE